MVSNNSKRVSLGVEFELKYIYIISFIIYPNDDKGIGAFKCVSFFLF